jgi:hypothetical protein
MKDWGCIARMKKSVPRGGRDEEGESGGRERPPRFLSLWGIRFGDPLDLTEKTHLSGRVFARREKLCRTEFIVTAAQPGESYLWRTLIGI